MHYVSHGGLRLREALRLEVGDIDRDRALLHIRQAKGNKDRTVPLPQATLPVRRQQGARHRPPTLLFPSRFRCHPQQATRSMGPSGVQKAFKVALQASGIGKAATPHTLRHFVAWFTPPPPTPSPPAESPEVQQASPPDGYLRRPRCGQPWRLTQKLRPNKRRARPP